MIRHLKKCILAMVLALGLYCGQDGYVDKIDELRTWQNAAPPAIVSITADDPDDADVAADIYSPGDTITVVFDQATNQPAAGSKADLDKLFIFSQSLGLNYWGSWANEATLVITVNDTTGGAATIGTLVITMREGNGLRTSVGSLAEAGGQSSAIGGDWGQFVCSPGKTFLLAGSSAGYTEGTRDAARFNTPIGIAADAAGNVYVADTFNHRIRKITPTGVTSLLAGSGIAGYDEGTGVAAQFHEPRGVAVDAAGNVYVADMRNHRIRKITPTGVTSLLAGSGVAGYAEGTGASAQFNLPNGIAVDAAGIVYVGDASNHKIRKITSSGVTSLLAGSSLGYANGTGAAARFNVPLAVAIDAAGSVFVGDSVNKRVRKITAAGVTSTLAGSSTFGYAEGTGATAVFTYLNGVAVDAHGNVFVGDYGNRRVRKITAAGVTSTLAGSSTSGYAEGTGSSAQFTAPQAVALDAVGHLYVADSGNHRIRKICTIPNGPAFVAVNGDDPDDGDTIYSIGDTITIVFDQTTNQPAVASKTDIGKLFSFNQNLGVDYTGLWSAASVLVITINDPAGATPPTIPGLEITMKAGNGLKDAIDSSYEASGSSPAAVGDWGNSCAAGTTSLFAGSGTAGYTEGTGATAQFRQSYGIGVDGANNVYVADSINHRIRKITPAGVTSLLAGSGTAGYFEGSGAAAQFDNPQGLAVDTSGNVYVADSNNHRIRKISPAGVTSLVAGSGVASYVEGTGAAAQFNAPFGIALDAAGTIYVSDTLNHRIRKISPAGVTSLLAGSTSGYAEGTGNGAKFSFPWGLSVDDGGNVYVADFVNHRIRKIQPTGVTSLLAGSTNGYLEGTGSGAQFQFPLGVTVDKGRNVFVVDTSNNRIRKISAAGVTSLLAGSGVGYAEAVGAAAQFNNPGSIGRDSAGNLYVTDVINYRIRKVCP